MKLFQKITSIVYALFGLVYLFSLLYMQLVFLAVSWQRGFILGWIGMALLLFTMVLSIVLAFKRRPSGVWSMIFAAAIVLQFGILSWAGANTLITFLYATSSGITFLLSGTFLAAVAMVNVVPSAGQIRIAPSCAALTQKIAAIVYDIFALFWVWLIAQTVRNAFFYFNRIAAERIIPVIIVSITAALILFTGVWMTVRAFKKTGSKWSILGVILPAVQTALLAWCALNQQLELNVEWFLIMAALDLLESSWQMFGGTLFFATVTLAAAAVLNISKKTEPVAEESQEEITV